MNPVNQSVIDGFNVISKQFNTADFHSVMFSKAMDELNTTEDLSIDCGVKAILDDCMCLSTEDMTLMRERLAVKANLSYMELIVLGISKIHLCAIGVGKFGNMNELDEVLFEDGLANFKVGLVSLRVSPDVVKDNLGELLKVKFKLMAKRFGANPINYASVGGITFAFK